MHAVGNRSIADLIREEACAQPTAKSEKIWKDLESRYPKVHFQWLYLCKVLKAQRQK